MISYELCKTVTENGSVSRGVCNISKDGYLNHIVERTRIEHVGDKICYTEDDGESWTELAEHTPVSMNFWGYTHMMMEELESQFPAFLEETVKENPLKGEYQIPKVTDGLIYTITLPDIAILSSVKDNVGSVRFYGAEVELHTVNVQTRDFRWETDLTYSYNRNVILSLPEEYKYEILDMFGNPTGEYGYRIGGTVTASGYRYAGTAVGEPLGRIWGYKVAGILQTEEQAAAAYYDGSSKGYRRSDGISSAGRKDVGDFEFVNRYGTAKTPDGKEQIDATDLFLLGNVMPHSVGGINNTFNWKRFTLNVYLDYALGHSIYNYMKTRMLQNTLGNSNANIDVTLFNQTWRYPGDDAKVARFFPNDADFGSRNYSRASDFNVERADYLCLRDVSLYYDLPDVVAKWFHMKRFTVGVTGNTLHYFTRVSGAISPETGMATGSSDSMYSSTNNADADGNLIPSTRKILFNVKLTF